METRNRSQSFLRGSCANQARDSVDEALVRWLELGDEVPLQDEFVVADRNDDEVGPLLTRDRRPQLSLRRMLMLVAACAVLAKGLSWMLDQSTDPREVLSGVLFGHDTVYSPTYDEWAFRRVRVGMTEADVLAVAGAPLRSRTIAPGRVLWIYTESPGDTNYWKRTIQFGSGRVLSVHSEFYFD